MKRLAVLGATVALAASASTVVAQAPTGITNNAAFQTRGTVVAPYTITQGANMEIATQTITFAPITGGVTATSGWHTHPGAVLTIVKSGTLSIWFSSDCLKRTVNAGQAIVVPGGGVFDLARNESADTPLVLVQTYHNLAVGGPLRTEAPGPQCQTGPPEGRAPAEMGVVGLTGTLHSRVRLPTAINTSVPAGTDVMIQELTFAPGGNTGWHTHPGVVTVQVSGPAGAVLTYVHHNCATTQYLAGTGFVDDPALGIHLARNDGTVAAVAYVTYTNLPAGGAVRSEASAPACAAPSPTAAPLPNTATGEGETGAPAAAFAAILLVACIASLSVVATLVRQRAR